MHKAIGSSVYLYTRPMYLVIETRDSWDSFISCSPRVINELQFWHNNVSQLNGRDLFDKTQVFDSVVYSDASQLGYGGYVISDKQNLVCQGQWSLDEKKIQDRLKSCHGEVTSVELFKGLQQTALSSKACGTVFANTNKLVVFPVSVADAALYFSHLATSQVSASVIESSYCALKWAHDFAGVPNPMSSTFVKNMVEGAKRQNAKPTSKKSPISKEALTECCIKHAHSDELPIRRDISMALLLFAGFFRFSELANLTTGDISIIDTHLTIKVSHSKTDQYRKGNEMVISRSGKVTCPVSNLERYMKLTGISTSKVSDFLFKPIVKVRSGYKVIDKVKPLSYTHAR
ncbi:unnamed protein product, partial [Porites lobata]